MVSEPLLSFNFSSDHSIVDCSKVGSTPLTISGIGPLLESHAKLFRGHSDNFTQVVALSVEIHGCLGGAFSGRLLVVGRGVRKRILRHNTVSLGFQRRLHLERW